MLLLPEPREDTLTLTVLGWQLLPVSQSAHN